MTKLSIIIPIYNLEKYINKLLDTITTQDLDDIQIICVDDGSSDNSVEVINTYANKYNSIKVIKQKNSGVSTARNRGIDYATGEYLFFIDGDDWIRTDTFEKLKKFLDKETPDILFFNHYLVINEKEIEIKIKIKEDFSNYVNYFDANVPFWAAIYKTSFIKEKKIKFPVNINYTEDHIFKINALLSAKKISFLNKTLYFYLKRKEGSATSNIKKGISGIINAYRYLKGTNCYINSSKENQLLITDVWSQFLFGIWSSNKVQKEDTRKLDDFIENYQNFERKKFNKLIGYKKLRYKHIWRTLKIIRNFLKY